MFLLFEQMSPTLGIASPSAGVPIPPSSGAGGKQWVAGAVELTILLDETSNLSYTSYPLVN